MNLKNFQNNISPIILQRGKAYFDDGVVITLEEQEIGIWCAEVEGSEVYSVEVKLSDNDEIESYFCDCPHDADICKHIVAVFFELRDEVKIIKLQPVSESKRIAFDTILKKITEAELKDFVAFYAKNNKNFIDQLEIYFTNKD